MKLIELFLSPIAFSIGFLAPLLAQVMLAMNTQLSTPVAYGTGLAISISFGIVAQSRGSWLWVKDQESDHE
ncbi:MAG: hypothetical protein VCA12_05100 [Pseudomonadales bacterium]|jgi:hypothetical protein